MISVLLPSTLRVNDSDHLEVHEDVRTIAELVEALDKTDSGLPRTARRLRLQLRRQRRDVADPRT